ncbi:hypothetical protein LINPERHAP2_LOCUS10266, partial [Linum perenne]
VLRFRELLNLSWQFDIKHVYCEGYRAGDYLAELGFSRSLGLHMMSCSGNGFSRFFLYDSLGVFEPHLILINIQGACLVIV